MSNQGRSTPIPNMQTHSKLFMLRQRVLLHLSQAAFTTAFVEMAMIQQFSISSSATPVASRLKNTTHSPSFES